MMRSVSGQCHATVRLQLQNQIETRRVWSGHEVVMKCPFNFHSNLTIYAVQVWSFVLRRLPVILLRLYSQLRLSCAQQITHYRNSEIWFQYWVCEIKLCYQWVRVVSCLGTLVFSGNCKCIFFFPTTPHLFRFMKTIWQPKYKERSHAKICLTVLRRCRLLTYKRKRPDKLKLWIPLKKAAKSKPVRRMACFDRDAT